MQTLHLMHGYPGSGKSYRAQQLWSAHGGIIINADEYFTFQVYNSTIECGDPYEDRYYFDANYLHEAHKMCQNRCRLLMARKYPVIIIDNTNLCYKELAVYVEEAGKHRYDVELVQPDTDWRDSIEECHRKGSHNVPFETYERMKSRREPYDKIVAKINENLESIVHFRGD